MQESPALKWCFVGPGISVGTSGTSAKTRWNEVRTLL
jgi:hypothetical protein